MKSALKIEKILTKVGDAQASNGEQAESKGTGNSGNEDAFTKVYFKNENLILRHKNGLTLAVRQQETQ